MKNFDFVSASDLSKKQTEVLQKLEGGKRLIIMRNNQPLGYIVGMNDPAIKWLEKENMEEM